MLPAWKSSAALAVLSFACAPRSAHVPPDANFLVAAGDSTLWVRTDSGRALVRRASMLLAVLDGRIQELYVTDDDRSFYDAVIVGQRIYRRDIVRGDSVAVFEDTSIAAIASRYAADHPRESPLAEDEDASDDPATVATTETEILEVVGPFATIERHVDIDLESGREVHTTVHAVLDLRSGRLISLRDLMPDSARARVIREGRRSFRQALDSVRRSSDDRARRAAPLLRHFRFDSASFGLVVSGAKPAIAFLAPGTGPSAGGFALPLDPIGLQAGDWWNVVMPTLPSQGRAEREVWRGAYDIIVEHGPAGSAAQLLIRDERGEEWPVGPIPTPVSGVHRLASAIEDGVTTAALTRAFDESVHYGEAIRTAAVPGSRPLHPFRTIGAAGRRANALTLRPLLRD
jgi:hypothetical protein